MFTLRLFSFLSRKPDGPDHSLSVAGELPDSSASPMLLPSPRPLIEEPEARLREEELALKSFSFSLPFSSKPIKIRDRASAYAAARSSIVRFLLLPALFPPRLPASDGSTSDRSASSPAAEPVCDKDLDFVSRCIICIILNAGCTVDSAGTSSLRRFMGILL